MGLTYNGVYLHHCRTLEFALEQELDATGTDAMWTAYHIRVRGFVSASASFPSDGAATFSGLMDKLAAPRRALSYSIGGTELVSHPGGLDAHLGPMVMKGYPRIHEVNTGLFLVEFGVVCRLVKCDTDCEENDPVVSLRWTQTETFDENWYSRLVTSGTLIVRSDLLQSADNFRPLATPDILPDYVRKSARYTLSPDGTQLAFNFEDQEVDRLPPLGVTKAAGKFTITSPKPGIQRFGQCNVRLEGPKGTDRADLLVRAIAMCYSKLTAENLNLTAHIIWGTFSEDLFDPVVEVNMQGMLSPLVNSGFLSRAVGVIVGNITGTASKPGIMRGVGVPPFGVSPGRTGLAPPERKRLAGLLTAAFRDPCACLVSEEELRSDGSTGPANTKMVAQGFGVPPAQIGIGELSNFKSGPEIFKDTAPYDIYDLHTSYGFHAGKVHMPATGVGKNGSNGKIVQVTGEKMVATVTWVAGRTGQPPILPRFESDDPNIVPLSGSIVEQATLPSADGGALIHLVAGFYQYALIGPQTAELVAGVPPFMAEVASGNAAPSAGFWSDTIFKLKATAGSGKGNPFTGDIQLDQPPPVQNDAQDIPITVLPPGPGLIGGFSDQGGSGGGAPINP